MERGLNVSLVLSLPDFEQQTYTFYRSGCVDQQVMKGRATMSLHSIRHSLTHLRCTPPIPVATLREGALLLSLPVLVLASHPSIIGSTTAHPLLYDRPLLQNTGAPEGRAGHLKVAAVLGRFPVHWGNTVVLVGQSDNEM